ncbi:TRAP transporter small permease [Peribacillus frigoritolerans]|uniref:TRAP transporter small permease n=1 Tax=Peribacillus frigoritolerans TaxID=450367 RepID=UPI001780B83B|nr:TRAP transporter small permease [Peribacillus frigoritolerans]MBD8138113.1 TRAP transporter small permease [Bacillus sp. CFBP 13597]MDP9742751.1 C4-dicarboxylate transporter DctQ subunit [Bacillus sp. B2I3]MED3835276.1 TRAP transporter small permease [Peribacillus frigoritolerans]MED3845627.1 TRAP transporter small permease [Peribacillus frigoritolerans]WVN11898.1 TRAP transporter small permease [Peribacillus frigoritolerans]
MSRVIGYIENFILAVTMLTMAVITFGNVISRYFFHYSLSFTEEITINLFVLLTFLGAAVGLRKNAHLGFSLLYEKSNLITRKALILLSTSIISIVFILLVFYGYDMMQFQMDRNLITPSLGWQQWVFSMFLPIGSFFCLYRSVEAGVIEWKSLVSREGIDI